MEYSRFEQFVEKVKAYEEVKRLVVAVAGDEHTIEAVMQAEEERIVKPILVGDKEVIQSILKDMGKVVPESDIYDVKDGALACQKAVSIIKEGKADVIMKGKIDTGIFLKAVVNKENGLGTGKIMSHFTVFEVPTYKKLLAAVDGGMVTYPTLEEKKGIIENTVQAFIDLGYEKPKVGVITCVEKVNPKMPETLEAFELQEMNRRGEIKNCIVEGPVSYDCAIDKEIADFKGYESEIAGDVDIMVAPNIHAGNIMGKMFTCTANSKMAGFIVGASCPVVMVSRGSSAEEKFMSIVLSAAAAK